MDYIERLDTKIFNLKAFDSNGNDITHLLPTDDLVYLDANKKLYLSSYIGGKVKYDYDRDTYIEIYYSSENDIDIAKITYSFKEED